MLGFTKKYVSSEIETDKLSDFFNHKIKRDFVYKEERGTQKQKRDENGFCIRTGVKIPFNLKHPMCETAFLNWKKFSNADYPEKFCHFSGEHSNGETTFSKPIQRKNWNKAMQR